MNQKFPRITAFITDVEDGYTVTVYFRKTKREAALLTDEPTDSIEAARAIVSDLASKTTVGANEIDIEVGEE
jgi:hypothetical protein